LGVAIPFPVIADLDTKVAKLFGMIHPQQSTTATVRSVFVIDPEMKLRAMIYYPLNVGRNMDEILRLINALQTADKYKWLRVRGRLLVVTIVKEAFSRYVECRPLKAFYRFRVGGGEGLITHYGAYLSLKERSEKVAEARSEEGWVEVYATPSDDLDVIPLVTLVFFSPLRPRQPTFYTHENVPRSELQKLLAGEG